MRKSLIKFVVLKVIVVICLSIACYCFISLPRLHAQENTFSDSTVRNEDERAIVIKDFHESVVKMRKELEGNFPPISSASDYAKGDDQTVLTHLIDWMGDLARDIDTLTAMVILAEDASNKELAKKILYVYIEDKIIKTWRDRQNLLELMPSVGKPKYETLKYVDQMKGFVNNFIELGRKVQNTYK